MVKQIKFEVIVTNWEGNGRWNPTLVPWLHKPPLVHVLGGIAETFRTDGSVALYGVWDRFVVTMHKPKDIVAHVHERLEIDPSDWWWINLPPNPKMIGDYVAISFKLSAHQRWHIKPISTSE